MQLAVGDDPDGFRVLRQVHADEVGLRQQFVEADQADAELGPAGRGHVRVVRNHRHAERRQTLGDENADLAKPENAGHLVLQFHAGEG